MIDYYSNSNEFNGNVNGRIQNYKTEEWYIKYKLKSTLKRKSDKPLFFLN